MIDLPPFHEDGEPRELLAFAKEKANISKHEQCKPLNSWQLCPENGRNAAL
jgi:hypothetical protein